MALGRATSLTAVRGPDAQQRTWDRLGDADRAAHHRYVCLGRTAGPDRAVVRHLTRQYEAEIGTYGIEDLTLEFKLPIRVNDNTELLTEVMGIVPGGIRIVPTTATDLDGLPAVQISVRVRDMPFDTLTLAVGRRVTVVPCTECLMDCWHDPVAVVDPANNIVRCIACCRWILFQERRRR